MQRLLTVDFSEGGCAVQFKHKVREFGPLLVTLALPGIDQELETEAEVAWQSPNNLIGLRFINTNAHAKHMLKTWVNQSFPDPEKDDPPVCSRLTDLSLGGCYLQITTPFPVRTRVTLSMRIRDLEIRVEGVVRVAHHDAGMGIEFTRVTQDQRQHVATFIEALRENAGALPDLLVEPEGLESDLAESANAEVDGDDNLLELFRTRSSAPVESFMRELRQQRHSPSPDPTETILEM